MHIQPTITLSPALLALYAEVHYKFRFGFSLLRIDFPEIIADLPWRIEAGEDIPILCLIKDADQYPIHLDEIVITLPWGRDGRRSRSFPMGGDLIQERFWHRLFYLSREDVRPGPAQIDVLFRGRRGTRPFQFHNDNYRHLSHTPLQTTLASQPLPGLPQWCPGDPHVHSSFTEDQVEFGAPPEATVQLARSMGLNWMAITDHSYDLDDCPGNPLRNDPDLAKWKGLTRWIEQLDEQQEKFTVLQGEEISCGNARGQNVHLLAFAVPHFIPGSGDSAERWLRCRPTLTVAQVLDQIRRAEAVAYAAHPEEPGSVLERILLRRGAWKKSDYGLTGLSGMQIWNGREDRGLQRGLNRWIQMLLQGRELFVIGGNDAHGNFNRFRQVRLPFVAMRESAEQIFGRVRTHLHCPHGVSQRAVLEALRRGRAVITNGPFVTFSAQNEKGRRASLGESIRGEQLVIRIQARSSREFGNLERIDVHWGKIGGEERRVRKLRRGSDFDGSEKADLSLELLRPGMSGYLRVELVTAAGSRNWRALTNPIWINFQPRAETGAVDPE